MAKFTVSVAGKAQEFEVADKWVKTLKLNPFSSLEEQVYKAALSDPEKAGLVASDDAVKAVVEDAKALVAKAKEVNKAHPLAKVRATVADIATGTFDVTVDGNVRNKALTKDAAMVALDEVNEFYAHTNLIHTKAIAVEKGETPEKIAEDITIAVNNAKKYGDVRKVIAIYPIPGVDGAVFYSYISEAANAAINHSYDCDDDGNEDEEDGLDC